MLSTCLFPAAGYGTRFLPATKAIPKEMLPVLTKPLLQYGVEEALAAGFQNMAIVTGRGKRAIEDHFDVSYELEHQIKNTDKEYHLTEIREIMDKCNFIYTRQNEMKGLGHAILTGRPLVNQKAFAVLLADDLCAADEGVLSQMVKIYEKYNCSVVAIQEVEKSQVNRYGIIAGEKLDDQCYRVNNMIEKPSPEEAPSNLAIIGRYILTSDIFDLLADQKPGKNGEIQITDSLMKQAQQGKVIAYKFHGRRFDCGNLDGFMDASNFFYTQFKER
ncbi:MAG: UTP--glucose-1-phosphate uridylyltransferase GalU [Spirochaetia bacterium]|nr:UTP--glucose-1-phosphate uridylyltransferase GalU [Spirochaetia bacterium]